MSPPATPDERAKRDGRLERGERRGERAGQPEPAGQLERAGQPEPAGPVERIERAAVSLMAVAGAAALLTVGALGPLGMSLIHYRVPAEALVHAWAQDLVGCALVAPACLWIGHLVWWGDDRGRRWLPLPGLFLAYTGLVYGAGNEWTGAAGNAERFLLLDVSLMVTGVALTAAGLWRIRPEDIPPFPDRARGRFAAVVAVALGAFHAAWLADLVRSGAAGPATSSIPMSPAAFWLIKLLDLGVITPLGLLATYRFWRAAPQGYALLLSFLGFTAATLAATSITAFRLGLLPLPGRLLLALASAAALAGVGWLVHGNTSTAGDPGTS
jgi:hypothetical protein